MNGKQLKNSILQWAIQGKLVPQDPNDEPASVLLERIRAEKAKLVKEKKIKKDKNESIIYRGEDNSYYEKFLATVEVKCIDEEIPFEIPKSWEWSRLGDICSYLHRGKSPKYGEHKFLPIIAQKCNQWDKIYTDRCLFSSKDYIEKYKEEQFVQKGDIIINSTGGGTVGRTGYIDSYVFANFDRFVVDSHVTLVRSIYPIASKYVYYFLISPLIQIGLEDRCSGSTNQIELGTTTITSYLVPIPPIKEQYRIIDQFQKVLPLLERYSTNQIAQDKLNAEINVQLKRSILQEAIQGRLVPQIAEEGTAQELLAEIHKEKERLVKEGKLKKSILSDSIIYKGDDNKYFEKIDKIEKDITDEIPFEIPVEWNWCRLGCIASIKGGKRIPVGEKLTTENTGHVYIRVADMKQNSVTDNDIHYVSEAIFQKIKAYTISSDDLYITVAGTIGNVGEIPSTFNNANLTENANKIVFKFISKKFLMYCLLSDFVQSQIKSCTTKVGQPKLAIIRIENLLIPLPPLKEQYRIVAKIEQLASIMRG